MRKIIKSARKVEKSTLQSFHSILDKLREEAKQLIVQPKYNHVGLVRFRPSGRLCP